MPASWSRRSRKFPMDCFISSAFRALRDQRHPIGDADQLLIQELLDSEIGQFLSITGPLDSAERQIRGAYRGVIDKHHAGLDSAGNPFAPLGIVGVNGAA